MTYNNRFVGWVLLAALVLGTIVTGTVAYASDGEVTATQLAQDGPISTPEPLTQNDLNLLSGNVLRPNGMTWHDGYLYVGCNGDFTIYRIEDTSGQTITYMSGIENASTLLVEDGETEPIIWVPDFSRDTLTLVDRSQSLANQRVDIASGIDAPWGIAELEDGSFLVSLFRTGEILRITRDGSVQTVASGFRSPTGIVIDDEGYVYVANHVSTRRSIEYYRLEDAENSLLTDGDMQQLVQGLQSTTNLVLGPDGYLYFAYALGQRGIVGRVDPQVCREKGGCTNFDVEPVVWTELQAPLVGLIITPDMRLYVHSQYGAEIYWVQLPTDAAAVNEPSNASSEDS